MREVYIDLKEYVKFPNRKIIYVKDIARVYSKEKIQNEVLNVPIDNGDKKTVTISALDVVKMIKGNIPFVEVRNVGPEDVVVYFDDFLQKDSIKNKCLKALELVFGVLIVFFGSFVAIMTFQTDVSLPSIFKHIYSFFTGIEEVKPLLIQLPYSLGIFIGAITFFTKFKKTGVSPLEIAIDQYEQDVKTSEVKRLEKEQGE